MTRAFVLLALPAIAAAQSTSLTIDAGTSNTRIADSVNASALTLSPALRLTSGNMSLSAFGVLSSFAGSTSNSGTVDLSLNSTPKGVFSIEGEGVAGGSAHSDGTATAQLLALGRLHIDGNGRGLWLGGGGGVTTDGTWRSVIQGDAGAWLGGRDWSSVLNVTPTVVDDSIKYTDVNVSAHRVVNAWELDGSLGFRGGDQMPALPANSKAWGSVTAAYWFAPQFAVVASAGTYPVDFTQGFPGGRYMSLNIRWRASRGATRTLEPASAAFGVTRFSVTGEGANRAIVVDAPNSRNVEITGDFTQWTPVVLTSVGGGRFTLTLPLSAGTYEMNVRIDGGRWLVPPGLTPFKDEFGLQSGVLVVR